MTAKGMKLGTIEQEKAACIKAFKGVCVGAWVRHCHHEVLYEKLTEPAINRISFIVSEKEPGEVALRLRLFRPATKAEATAGKAYKEATATAWKAYGEAVATAQKALRRVHDKHCKCPWNGQTIFPEAKP